MCFNSQLSSTCNMSSLCCIFISCCMSLSFPVYIQCMMINIYVFGTISILAIQIFLTLYYFTDNIICRLNGRCCVQYCWHFRLQASVHRKLNQYWHGPVTQHFFKLWVAAVHTRVSNFSFFKSYVVFEFVIQVNKKLNVCKQF